MDHQNVTLSLPKTLLRKAKIVAALCVNISEISALGYIRVAGVEEKTIWRVR